VAVGPDIQKAFICREKIKSGLARGLRHRLPETKPLDFSA
jgi:hypothetical protein